MNEIITLRNIAELKRWNRNYREGDVGAIIQSILTFGYNGALRVWKENTVVAGNHALIALQSMKASGMPIPRGITERDGAWFAPCVDVSHLTRIQAEAFAVADNRTQELGHNDAEQLAQVLADIGSESEELLKATGYDGDDLDAILASLSDAYGGAEDPGAQIDRAEELNQLWQVQRGDLWQIGNHRLLCGDSTNADDVARVGVDDCLMMVTDPPYGVEYDQEWRSSNRIGKVTNDNNADWRIVFELAATEIVYCWHAGWSGSMFELALRNCNYDIRAQIIWNKSRHVFSQGHYHWKHEPCFYAVKKMEQHTGSVNGRTIQYGI